MSEAFWQGTVFTPAQREAAREQFELTVGQRMVSARRKGDQYHIVRSPGMGTNRDRIVTLNLTGEQIDMIALDPAIGYDKLHQAIGRLATWAPDAYPHVQIHQAGGQPTELVATYRDEHRQPRYTIAAVWHGDHFGYHS